MPAYATRQSGILTSLFLARKGNEQPRAYEIRGLPFSDQTLPLSFLAVFLDALIPPQEHQSKSRTGPVGLEVEL